jgi:DUF4097 and DUF4098 domain-containing protein YvlB
MPAGLSAGFLGHGNLVPFSTNSKQRRRIMQLAGRIGRYSVISIGATLLLLAAPAFAAEGHFERTLQVSGNPNVQIETGSGSIEVRAGSGNEIQVNGHIKRSDWFAGDGDEKIKRLESNPPIQQSGNDVRIGHIDDPELKRNVSISYEVVVPAATQLRSNSGSGEITISGLSGTVEAGTGSGNVKLTDIGSAVRAHTGSGNVDLEGVKGNVWARTGSGSIRATNVSGAFDGQTGSGHLVLEQTGSGSVRAETGSGGLELHNVRGSLQALAGSGNIKAEGEATGGWMVHTGSGNVELRLPQNASFDLNAHTGSGSINLGHPVTVHGSVGRKEVRGKAGNGGVPIEVQTGSGDILID